ncbi:MAG: cytochrome b/b6 domain-containing protein [Euryarchaeota archaeon]|nr:cytochrome b/b6 domain-containing protein [Euryarchaeota archaeon]MBU4454660.1 cytochrome b/b6 domain-containing protein [Euryarchaeota archaeon]MCG2736084.1 cytochrome b/b6 domain-containing protein [Candidatus Methanoperedenaceae archaeon]
MNNLIFKRFTLNQCIQHIILFITIILLAYTGFPLKFPEEWWSKWMIDSVGGFDNRTLIHRYSGLLMIGVAVYHVIFHLLLEKPRIDVLFNLQDLKDLKQQMRYYLRLSDEHPRFGRYTWKQKFEYFGGGFGVIVMGISGLIMWFPFEAMKYFPLGVVQIASLFHTWEAVLASLAIFIGHFYDEHIGKFPNMSWITGNISEEEMRHEHPLEYEEVMKDQEIKDEVTETDHRKDTGLITVFAKVVFTVIFLAITVWMLWISYMVLVEAVTTYIL